MTLRTFGLPAWAATLIWLLIVVVVIILFALIVHALGGFSWAVHIGHFRFLIAVT